MLFNCALEVVMNKILNMDVDKHEDGVSRTALNQTSSCGSFISIEELERQRSNEIRHLTYTEELPESIRCSSTEKMTCVDLLSPKFAPRSPKFKMNLNVPENISNIDIYSNEFNDKIDDIKSNLYHPKLSQGILPTSEQLKFLKLYKEKLTNINMQQKISLRIDNAILHKRLNNQKKNFYCREINETPSLTSSTKLIDNMNLEIDSLMIPSKIPFPHTHNNKIIEKIETHVPMNESLVVYKNSQTSNNLLNKFELWKVPLIKFYGFTCWLSNKIFQLIKNNYRRFCQNFLPTGSDSTTILRNEKYHDHIEEITSVIRTENERMMALLTVEHNNMSRELNKVQVMNESTLLVLKSEFDHLKNISLKLIENNGVLTSELKFLSKKLDETIQMNSATHLPIREPTLTSCAPAPLPPPPPVPPPPPLPPSVSLSLPTTSKYQNHHRISHTPTRKSSAPLTECRPRITVEELRKVTLKKISCKNKENYPRRNDVEASRVPVVSLDMLRSVTLKSIKRSHSNANTKKVRSPRHTLKNRGNQSFSVSPIMTGAVSPLSRIFKSVDNRKASEQTLMSPTHDNNLRKDNSKQLDEPQPSTLSHTIIV